MLVADKNKMYYIKMETTEFGATNTEDIMVGTGYEWDETIEAYVVEDAEGAVEYANEWKNFETETDLDMLYDDEHIFDGAYRTAEISDVTPVLMGRTLDAAKECGSITVSAEGNGRYLVIAGDVTEPFPATEIDYVESFIEALKRYNDLKGVEVIEF